MALKTTLKPSGDAARDELASVSDRTFQMTLFHSLGTTLASTHGLENDADVQAARRLAEDVCAPNAQTKGSERTRLTFACLDRAITLRRELNETPNQISGTLENQTFLFLQDKDYESAFKNTVNVEQSGLFAWNELLRAISADRVGEWQVAIQARRNVSLFAPSQFNVCELRALRPANLYEEARQIISTQHYGIDVDCPLPG